MEFLNGTRLSIRVPFNIALGILHIATRTCRSIILSHYIATCRNIVRFALCIAITLCCER